MTPATPPARPRRWPGAVAWTLWALAMAACLVIPWLDQQLRRAGRPDLAEWNLRPGAALVSAATVGQCWPAAAQRTRWAGWPRTIRAFSTHLRDQLDLDTLRGELLAVVDQTMQPTQASLWLRVRP